MKQGLGDKKNMRDNLERHHRFKIVNQHSAPALGLAEILEKMKFCTLNFASYVFGSKIQFEKHFTKQFFLIRGHFDTQKWSYMFGRKYKGF